jgi:hypothetical protein
MGTKDKQFTNPIDSVEKRHHNDQEFLGKRCAWVLINAASAGCHPDSASPTTDLSAVGFYGFAGIARH